MKTDIRKVEIYGIPEDIARCYGCISAVRLLERLGIDYTFYPILKHSDNELGFEYDRDRISELQRRVGKPTPPTNYPQILIDDVWVGGFLKMKAYFGDDE